jgi:hypothetical protein
MNVAGKAVVIEREVGFACLQYGWAIPGIVPASILRLLSATSAPAALSAACLFRDSRKTP